MSCLIFCDTLHRITQRYKYPIIIMYCLYICHHYWYISERYFSNYNPYIVELRLVLVSMRKILNEKCSLPPKYVLILIQIFHCFWISAFLLASLLSSFLLNVSQFEWIDKRFFECCSVMRIFPGIVNYVLSRTYLWIGQTFLISLIETICVFSLSACFLLIWEWTKYFYWMW